MQWIQGKHQAKTTDPNLVLQGFNLKNIKTHWSEIYIPRRDLYCNMQGDHHVMAKRR